MVDWVIKQRPDYTVVKDGQQVADLHKVLHSEQVPTMIDAPWVSQLGPTAAFSGSDCGPACVTMWLHLRGHLKVTVDDVSKQTKLPRGYKYTMPLHLMAALNDWGIKTYWRRNLQLKDLKAELDVGEPCILLVEYDRLPLRMQFDLTYKYSHWVLLTGYDTGRETAPESYYLHDPYWPSTAKGAHAKLNFVELEAAWGSVSESGNSNFQAIRKWRGD